MPRSRAKTLTSLFLSAAESAVVVSKPPSSSGATLKLRPSTPVKTELNFKISVKSPLKNTDNLSPVSDIIQQSLDDDSSPFTSDDSTKQVAYDISSILTGGDAWELDDEDSTEPEVDEDENNAKRDSDISWCSNLFNNSLSLHRKELCRERKSKWIFKKTQKNRIDKLVSMCLEKVGSGSTFQVLFKLGRETGLQEYNAFIKGCIETARSSEDERVQMEQILEIYQVLELMKERGFAIEEETFGPFLLFLIDMRLTDQFSIFLEIINDEDPDLLPRLGYYEMLLWIEIKNEEKIQELCNNIIDGESTKGSLFHENYLMALCKRNREKELHQLLAILDITTVSSLDYVACIFQALGRLSLEHFSQLFIQALKGCDYMAQNISDLIYHYASSMENLAVEDVILKFKEMHTKLDVELLPGSYEKLITFCCDSRMVHLALDLVDEMTEAGLPLSTETLNSICRACEDTSEFILARRIHPMLQQQNLKPNTETFRSLINLHVRMKDFDGAYAMLNDLQRFNLTPTGSMYNAIIAGFYREKKVNGVLRVLQEMEEANVKPDSQTFSFLISNSTSEEEIIKYFKELKSAGVLVTKYVLMALINAYAACGYFEKAKQVVLEKGVPVKYITEIKSALVSTLASHGKISDALDIYMEIKQSGHCVEPKALIALIENLRSEGNLSILLELLAAVKDKHYWVDGCCRVILYCVRNKDLRSSVDLLKKLAHHFRDDDVAREVIFDEMFSQIADMESPDLEIGLGLLRAVKKDLNLHPSRKCLDFFLSACVFNKDLPKAQLVWKEYEIADLPYNILSYLRMYQAYLASGSLKAANKFLRQVPRDDPHVQAVIHACGVTYGNSTGKRKKNKRT